MDYKFNVVGSDFTIQINSGQVVTHAGTSQATATVVGSKIKIQTFYPYFEAFIDKTVHNIFINGTNVTANAIDSIVSSLNSTVFAGGSGGGTNQFTDAEAITLKQLAATAQTP